MKDGAHSRRDMYRQCPPPQSARRPGTWRLPETVQDKKAQRH